MAGPPGQQAGGFNVTAPRHLVQAGEGSRYLMTLSLATQERAPEAPEEVGVGPAGQRAARAAGVTNCPDAALWGFFCFCFFN